MSESVKHIKSKALSPLEASDWTRALTGTFTVATGTLSGLPNKHGIKTGDLVSYEITGGVPNVIETGIVAGSDLSAYAGGLLGNIGYLQIDQTLSQFDYPGTYPDQATARAAAAAVFTLGSTVYFSSGIFSGASIEIGELATVPGITVHDSTTAPGLAPGYWFIIIDFSTAVSFPALAAFPSTTTITPPVDIEDGMGGSTTVTDAVVTSAAANSVVLVGASDGTGITSLSVRTDSSIAGKVNVEELDAETLTQSGVPVPVTAKQVPYGPGLSNFIEQWIGTDFNGDPISNASPLLELTPPTDPFGNGVTNQIIQLFSHPDPDKRHVGIALYQDIGDSKIYLRAFTFNYDVENDFQLYPPTEIVGADSTDIRASFATTLFQTTREYTNTSIFVFGGKATPGTNAWGGIYVVETDLTITADTAWGDTSYNVDNTFSGIVKVVDLKPTYSSVNRKRVLVLFGDNVALFDEDLIRQWNGSLDPSLVGLDVDYIGDSSNGVLAVTGSQMVDISGGVASLDVYDVPTNNYVAMDKVFTGSSRAVLNLYKVDRFEGVGLEGILSDSFNADPAQAVRFSTFEYVPTNFQNTSGKLQNSVFELGNNLILFYKSYGYYVILERNTGKLVYIGRDSDSDTIEKNDPFTVVLNDNTLLNLDGSTWAVKRFLTEGPYYLYAKLPGGTTALSLPSSGYVTTDFALQVGRTYYTTYTEFLTTNKSIGTKPWFAPRKLGTAIASNIFKVEIDNEVKFTNRLELRFAQTPGTVAVPGQDLGNGEFVDPIVAKIVNPHYLERYFRYRREIPRWETFTVNMSQFQITSPFTATEAGFRIGVDDTGYGGGVPTANVSIHQVVLMTGTNVTGTGLSSALLSLGTEDGTVNWENLAPALEVFGVTARSNTVANAIVGGTVHEDIYIYMRTTGANVLDCNGSVKVAILWSYYGHLL